MSPSPNAGATAQFCYLLFCHTAPGSALRLVRRIKALSPSAPVVVRFEPTDFLSAQDVRAAGGIPFVSAIATSWGSVSLVDMMLECLRFAIRETSASHFVTISGQCYPIVDLAEWQRERVAGPPYDALINRNSADRAPAQDHEYSWRLIQFATLRPRALNRMVRYASWRLGRLLDHWLIIAPRRAATDRNVWFVGLRRRHYDGTGPDGIEVVKASQWMTLTRTALERVLATIDRGGPLIDFLRSIRIPDEGLIQSLLCHDDGIDVGQGVTSSAVFLPGRSSPEWATAASIQQHRATGAPFMRKVLPTAEEAFFAAADDLTAGCTPPAT